MEGDGYPIRRVRAGLLVCRAGEPDAENHDPDRRGIPNRKKSKRERQFLAISITFPISIRSKPQPLRDSSQATQEPVARRGSILSESPPPGGGAKAS